MLLIPNSSSASDGNKILPPNTNNWLLSREGIDELTDLQFSDQVSQTVEQIFNKITATHIPLRDAVSTINDEFLYLWGTLSMDEKKLLLFSPAWSSIIFTKTGDHSIKKTVDNLLQMYDIRQPRYKPCSLKTLENLDPKKYSIYYGRIHRTTCEVFNDKLADCRCF